MLDIWVVSTVGFHYSHVTHKVILVNNGPHIQWWPHTIMMERFFFFFWPSDIMASVVTARPITHGFHHGLLHQNVCLRNSMFIKLSLLGFFLQAYLSANLSSWPTNNWAEISHYGDLSIYLNVVLPICFIYLKWFLIRGIHALNYYIFLVNCHYTVTLSISIKTFFLQVYLILVKSCQFSFIAFWSMFFPNFLLSIFVCP